MKHPLLLSCLALSFASFPSPAPAAQDVAATPASPDADEARQIEALERANALATGGKPADALPIIDAVIARYAARYPEGETRWYVGRSTIETLYYMADSAVSGGEPGTKNASALTVAWADAWYLKAYSLVELGRLNEAKQALARALHLSPKNANYLIELAEVSKLERNWDEAMRLYVQAEAATEFTPEELQKSERGKAMRGQAFVMIEQGRLDDARAMLRRCLKLDRNDQRARDELDYIEKLRGKGG